MDDKMKKDDIPFSFPVKAGNISTHPTLIKIEVNKDECAKLARVWGILDVVSMNVEVKLTRWKYDGVRLTGQINAKLMQTCVISLQPVQTDINEEFVAHYIPATSKLARRYGKIVIDVDEPDIPDIFTNDMIDIGMVITEYAAMAIDPYPRRKDAKLSKSFQQQNHDDKSPSPFTILASIKDKLNSSIE